MERFRNETDMMELADKYIKTAIVNMLSIHINLKANVSIMRRMEHMKMNHMNYVRIKTMIYNIKILLDGINCILNSFRK